MYKAEHIDFSYLVGDATLVGLREKLTIVRKHQPRGFCVNQAVCDFFGVHDDIVRAFYQELPGHNVLRVFTIDFPLGQCVAAIKRAQADYLMRLNEVADEFDIVANIGALRADDFAAFERELKPIIALGKPVKVIVETGYYPDDEAVLERALEWCVKVGAFAIKTSTGFIKNIDNAKKLEHVALWRRLITERGYEIKIKDAGGKKNRQDIDASLTAGADIIGASSVIE